MANRMMLATDRVGIDHRTKPDQITVEAVNLDECQIEEGRAPGICRFCRPVKERVPDYRCVLCDPRKGD